MEFPKDFLFQILLFIAGVVLAIVIPKLHENWQKFIATILSVFLIFGTAFWVWRSLIPEISNLPSNKLSTPVSNPVSGNTPDTLSVIDWTHGSLLYQEDFEGSQVSGWDIPGYCYQRIQESNGNQAWQATTNCQAYLTLPVSSDNYAMEAKIMQVSGEQALAGLEARVIDGKPCQSKYSTYFDTSLGWLTLVDFGLTTNGTCDELQGGGIGFKDAKRFPFSNGVWYKLRIELKGADIRVYLNDQFMLHATDSSLHSNLVGISSYSGSSEFVINFDDIKIWSLEP